jgi:hypothetical protein
VRDEIREGWSWLWAHAAVRTLAITIFTFNVTFGAAWSVLVLYARERLGLGVVGFGLISTAIAAGGLLQIARRRANPGRRPGRAGLTTARQSPASAPSHSTQRTGPDGQSPFLRPQGPGGAR